jgi:hypothetical protein
METAPRGGCQGPRRGLRPAAASKPSGGQEQSTGMTRQGHRGCDESRAPRVDASSRAAESLFIHRVPSTAVQRSTYDGRDDAEKKNRCTPAAERLARCDNHR